MFSHDQAAIQKPALDLGGAWLAEGASGLDEVIDRARSGDREAFGELYRTYHHRVLRLCRGFFRREEDAEDATSEVFMKLGHGLSKLNPSLPFLPWLLSVARNHCIDKLRQHRREQRVFVPEEAAPAAQGTPATSPLHLLLDYERRSRVREEVCRLPACYRLPLALRCYEEMSYGAIARRLGKGLGGVKTLIFRAKKELRRRLVNGNGAGKEARLRGARFPSRIAARAAFSPCAAD